MLLDKAAFQHQGFEFAVGEDIFKVLHVADHLADFFVVILFTATILADAVFQRLGLSNIDDLPCLAVHDIHTGVQW